jgi:hypothetical protein
MGIAAQWHRHLGSSDEHCTTAQRRQDGRQPGREDGETADGVETVHDNPV